MRIRLWRPVFSGVYVFLWASVTTGLHVSLLVRSREDWFVKVCARVYVSMTECALTGENTRNRGCECVSSSV